MAVHKHLKFTPPQNLHKNAKGPFEATGYELYYYAANEKDEEGKTLVSTTLDRTQMWDCNTASGTNTSYEFVGLPEAAGGVHFTSIRDLPCPCHSCRSINYAGCVLQDICGNVELRTMVFKAPVDCPDMLTSPLTVYDKNVLKAFIKLRSGKAPKENVRKNELIRIIVNKYREYVVFEPPVRV